MPSYTFDCKLFAAFTVDAETEQEARALLTEALDCAEIRIKLELGGGRLTGEASLDGDLDLVEGD